MTSQAAAAAPSRAFPGPGSLVSDGEIEALRPGHTLPWDPAAAGRYLAGQGDGWHAVERDWADRVTAHAGDRACGAPLTVGAVCGQLATLPRHPGAYDRPAAPVRANPCPHCAWAVAIATGSTGRELSFLRPRPCEAAAIARIGADPLLAFQVCQAILAAEHGPGAAFGLDHPATAQILAYATRHRPVLLRHCEQDQSPDDASPGRDLADRGATDCGCGDSTAICTACTLWAGPWAGEWADTSIAECIVTGPCSVLTTLAASYRVQATLPGWPPPAAACPAAL
jgi:hypothetical protein